MNEAASDQSAWPEMHGAELTGSERRRRWLRVGGIVGGILAVAAGSVWLSRERIADNIIAGQLRQHGLQGRYRIDSIGPGRQVLSNLVIGDPAHPDLTVERAEIVIEPRLGFPAISRVKLVRPRIYGSWRNGKLSFGTLDPVLFSGPATTPFRLPEMDITVVDGRARLLSDHGPIGFHLTGQGPLRDGFSGTFAAIAPKLDGAGCTAQAASLYGTVRVTAEQPHFAGPLRLAALDCVPGGLRLRNAMVEIDGTADKALDGGTVRLGVGSGLLNYGSARAKGLNGTVDATWRNAMLTARYDLRGRGLATGAATAATLGAKGTLRTRSGFAKVEVEGALDGGGVQLGEGLAATLHGYRVAAKDSLVDPLLGQFVTALQREGRGSKVAADFILRRNGDAINVVVPQGRVVGGSGAPLLTLSRLQYASGAGAPRLAGNFASGGAGLPRIAGRMERTGRGDTLVRMSMAEYRAGDARLALPQLVVAQTRGGALGFSGLARASGPLPGGFARNLAVPIEGSRTAAGVTLLWRKCATVRFDGLAYANLALEQRSLLICPGPGGAIVRSDGQGTRIAAGVPAIDVAGHLGETPIRIVSGPVGYASPGALFAKGVDVALGPDDAATRFRLADVHARVGADIAGTFAGTEVRLSAVPMDLLDAQGTWRYANGRLSIADGSLRVVDRERDARFQPLIANGATLDLFDNRLNVKALLREPASGREVMQVAVRHDLARGAGHADLLVADLVFDQRLQPDTLTRQLLGVIANASGTLRGRGAIDWTPRGVVSSGRFSTDSLDFAAAFGPVKGAEGVIEFSDLINFVSPPHQRLKIASINPGIEVTDGEILFQLKPRSRLSVEGGSWPFLGGTLRLQPVDLNLGVAETRRYVLGLTGLDAAKFVQQMDLENLAATGRFDGTLPLVFDENGGRIEGGLLISQPPGGNVAYVGALTYKDLTPIANFAFDALKSLDYRQMRIAMDGALEGEIVTRVRFDGVKQGSGAKRNFLTQRFARLPLQFNVNLRAPFYQLITSFKAIYDPAFIKDPRTIGLIDATGRPIAQPQLVVPIPPPVSAGGGIQHPVSESKP